MQIKHFILATSILVALLTSVSIAADTSDASNTKKTQTTQQTTPTTTTQSSSTTVASTTTTQKPKVKIIDSALCKKCFCDIDNHQLDCSKRKLKEWFTDEEWQILQNGDYQFEIINLEYNNLTKIPQLREYPVKNLYLAFNQINEISIAAFQNLADLTKLDLSYNAITSKILVPDVFKGRYSASDYLPLDKLKELNLCHNELHTLDADLFEHLPKLESLALCKNTFKVIDHLTETAIAGLTSLKSLDMTYMEIKELPEHFLHGPRDLETLILTGNLLTSLPQNLELAVNLNALILDENLIENIGGKNAFPAMKNLRYLSISYMDELKSIEAGGLSNLQNLTTLIASNNPKLSYIDKAALYRNTKNPMYHDYPPLTQLYLHNNNLTTLDMELIYRWDKVQNIDLRFNPWRCDESNKFLANILLPQINNALPVLAKDVICYSPPELREVPLLNARAKAAVNGNGSSSSITSAILVVSLVALLVGAPIIIATVVIYRRGCFGLLYGRASPVSAQYSRADSADDLHI